MGASFRCRRGGHIREKNAATADQRTLGGISKAARRGCEQSDPPTMILMTQSKSVNIVASNFFSHVHCASHLGVVSLSLNVRQFCLLHQHRRQCLVRAIQSKPSSMAAKPPPAALMDASAGHASHPLETHGVEELALEATKEHIIKMGTWRQAAALAVQDNFFILVIVRICKESERAVDKPLRGAVQRHSGEVHGRRRKAAFRSGHAGLGGGCRARGVDEVSGAGRRVGVYGREGRPDSASDRIHHEPHAPPPRRLRYAFEAGLCDS